MAIQIVMDRTGDTRHEFDVANSEAVALAEERFRQLTGKGFRAVALSGDGGPGKLVDKFDPRSSRPCSSRSCKAVDGRRMERIRNLLRVLLRRALSEHGREAPALTDITIERASGRFEPRIGAYFANGYATWVPYDPTTAMPFASATRPGTCPACAGPAVRGARDIFARCARRIWPT